MEILTQIKKLLFADAATTDTTPPPAPTSTDYTTSDGSTLSIDKLAIGGIVTQNGAPVADGSYTLQDGTSLTTVSGVISEIETKQQEATEPVEEMKKEVAAMQSQLVSLVAENKQLKEVFAKQNEANKLIVEVLEKFAAQATTAPLEQPKQWEDMTPLERFRATKTN